MPKPFYAEQTVVVDGETLRLAINFHAIDATEQLLGCSYDVVLGKLQETDEDGVLTAPLGFQGKVLWGLLREHHPETTLDQTASLLFGETGATVGLALERLLHAAFPQAEKEKAKNPPKPRGASKPS